MELKVLENPGGQGEVRWVILVAIMDDSVQLKIINVLKNLDGESPYKIGETFTSNLELFHVWSVKEFYYRTEEDKKSNRKSSAILDQRHKELSEIQKTLEEYEITQGKQVAQ